MIENKSAAIMAEITKAVIGKNDIVEKILMAVLAGGHVLMEDIPAWKNDHGSGFSRVLSPKETVCSSLGRYALGYHRLFPFFRKIKRICISARSHHVQLVPGR